MKLRDRIMAKFGYYRIKTYLEARMDYQEPHIQYIEIYIDGERVVPEKSFSFQVTNPIFYTEEEE